MSTLISFPQICAEKLLRILVICCTIFTACGSYDQNVKDRITLAAVGDKRIITADDFAQRALYAKRPEYCAENHFIHKKIILNSLIAEKICALEEGEDNLLTSSPRFQVYLKSLRELAMRHQLFLNDFYKPAKADSIELEKALRVAHRVYEIAYFTLADRQSADSVRHLLYAKQNTFSHVLSRIANVDSLPTRKVKWLTEQNGILKEKLYQDSVKTGTLMGPIQHTDSSWILIKVLDVQEKGLKNEIQQHATKSILKEKLRGENAVHAFEQYKSRLVKSTFVSFDSTILHTVLDTIRVIYAHSQIVGKKSGNQYWRHKDNCLQFDELVNHFEQQRNEMFFHVNGTAWTVERFLLEVASHPLRLDCRHINDQLAHHFKNAVVDLLRDKAITDESYNRGYDQLEKIDHYVLMFKDAYVAELHREFYLQDIGKQADFTSSYTYVTKQYLNPYIQNLLMKYADEIVVNNQLLQKIDLNNYYSFAFDDNNPASLLVPRFPILTTRKWLDYSS